MRAAGGRPRWLPTRAPPCTPWPEDRASSPLGRMSSEKPRSPTELTPRGTETRPQPCSRATASELVSLSSKLSDLGRNWGTAGDPESDDSLSPRGGPGLVEGLTHRAAPAAAPPPPPCRTLGSSSPSRVSNNEDKALLIWCPDSASCTDSGNRPAFSLSLSLLTSLLKQQPMFES